MLYPIPFNKLSRTFLFQNSAIIKRSFHNASIRLNKQFLELPESSFSSNNNSASGGFNNNSTSGGFNNNNFHTRKNDYSYPHPNETYTSYINSKMISKGEYDFLKKLGIGMLAGIAIIFFMKNEKDKLEKIDKYVKDIYDKQETNNNNNNNNNNNSSKQVNIIIDNNTNKTELKELKNSIEVLKRQNDDLKKKIFSLSDKLEEKNKNKNNHNMVSTKDNKNITIQINL